MRRPDDASRGVQLAGIGIVSGPFLDHPAGLAFTVTGGQTDKAVYPALEADEAVTHVRVLPARAPN